MKIADYIRDPEYASAEEIFNAKFNSVEDVIALQNEISKEEKEFDNIYNKYYAAIKNIKVCLSIILLEEENLRKRKIFKESHIGKLIQAFIEDNTEKNLNAIKKEIESSNEFSVTIVPEWQPGMRERMYGVPQSALFNIGYTETFYPFDKWNIDEDIERTEIEIENAKEQLQTAISIKDAFDKEYGITSFVPICEQFEKRNGPLKADSEWAHWYMLDDYDDDNDDDDDD